MKRFDHRILRAACLLAALTLAGFAGTAEADYGDCIAWCDIQRTQCIEACPPLGSPSHFTCIFQCNQAYKYCTATC